MVSKFLKLAAVAVVAAGTFAASAASAGTTINGVKTIVITNANNPKSHNLDYLQIGNFSSLVGGVDVAHSINGATAVNGATNTDAAAFGTFASQAIDESYSSVYPDIFHSGNGSTDSLIITLANISSISNASITGRYGFEARDFYKVTFLDAAGTALHSEILDARHAVNTEVAPGVTSVTSFVPEPATWAMMIIGFGVVGGVMRRRKAVATPAFA